MQNPLSQSEHISELAQELLDDIELGRIAIEQLLLKTSRLARLVGSDEIRQWLKFEINGYTGTSEICLKYMGKTGRWTDKNEKKGYWHNLSDIESNIQSYKMQLQNLRIPDVSTSLSSANPRQFVSAESVVAPITSVMTRANALQNIVGAFSGIRSRVLGQIHEFITDVYYERLFSGMAESVFEQYKDSVDKHLSGRCGDILEKFPSVYNRLAEGNAESISQALTTCRRIIDSFADAIFPATDPMTGPDGNPVLLDQAKPLNRIQAYVQQRTLSESRRDKIRRSLGDLYKRANSGVHSDVSLDETRSLLLSVYLVLGEIITLSPPSIAAIPE